MPHSAPAADTRLGHRLLAGMACAALLACAAAPAQAEDNKAKAARFYEDALSRFERKDISGSIIQLKNALQADKTLLPVQLLLARALMADGQVAAAEVAITEALRLGVDRAEVVQTLGQALLAQGKHEQLLEQARMAPAGLPNSVRLQVLLLRASAQSDLGDPAAALKSVQEARAIDPTAIETWLAEVGIRVRGRQFNEANAAADAAIKLDPRSAEAYYQRGSVAHARGQVTEAMKAYDTSLSLDPGHYESRLARAGLNLDANRNAEALADIAEARKLQPREPRAAYLQAVLADRSGDRPAARAALSQVTALLDPVPLDFVKYRPQMLLLNGLSHFALDEGEKARPLLEAFVRAQPLTPVSKILAQLYLKAKDPDRAIGVLEAYLRGIPGDSKALVQLATAQMAKGRPARATQLMQEALRARDVPELRTVLGVSLLQSGDGTGARSELEASFKKDPKQLQAGMGLMALYLREREPAKAAEVANQLLRNQPNNPALLNTAGVAKAEAGDFGGARRAFEHALAIDKTLTASQLGLARVDIATGALHAAEVRLKTLLKADERNPEVIYDLAVLTMRKGQADEALNLLRRAADVSPKGDSRAQEAIIEYQLRQGRGVQALEAAKVLLAQAPEDVNYLTLYARAQLASGDGAGAKLTLTNATRRAGYGTFALTSLARLQLAANDLDGAGYTLEKVLSADAQFLAAQALLANIETRKGDFAKAEPRISRIISQYPKLGTGYGLLGDLASARRQPAAAIDAYRQAHKVEPSVGTALALINSLGAQGQVQEARNVADAWLKANPADGQIQRALANLLARTGDFARAKLAYEAVVKQTPDDVEALNNLANVHLRLKDTRSAISTAEQAVSKAPTNPIVIDTLGWALFEGGQTDAALAKLRDARLRAPSNPDIRYHLASVLVKQGKLTEARDELTTALRDYPHFESQVAAKALLATLK